MAICAYQKKKTENHNFCVNFVLYRDAILAEGAFMNKTKEYFLVPNGSRKKLDMRYTLSQNQTFTKNKPLRDVQLEAVCKFFRFYLKNPRCFKIGNFHRF